MLELSSSLKRSGILGSITAFRRKVLDRPQAIPLLLLCQIVDQAGGLTRNATSASIVVVLPTKRCAELALEDALCSEQRAAK